MLDAASAGEKILIERDHKPLAVLVSVDEVRALEAEDEAVAKELAALDALIAIGDEWRRTHPHQQDELTAEETVRADRDDGHVDEVDQRWTALPDVAPTYVLPSVIPSPRGPVREP